MAKTLNESFKKLTDAQLMAVCIYGEARSEPLAGKIAVAHVIMNRAKRGGWWGSTIQSVILKTKQFSCFNEGDPNRLRLMTIAATWDKTFQKNRILRECFYVAEGVIEGDLRDPTDGADHYNTLDSDPSWDDNMRPTCIIGRHEFFKETA